MKNIVCLCGYIWISVSLLNGNTLRADELKTLLYSPAERDALVAARNGITHSAIYQLSGIVLRSSGRNVAWINGQAASEMQANSSISGQIPGLIIKRDHVLIKNKVLKVGDTLDIISGQRGSRLPTGAVKVKP